MSGDIAYELALAAAEEYRRRRWCWECGLYGVYGDDLCECETCGLPVHEGGCETSHYHDEHEQEDR